MSNCACIIRDFSNFTHSCCGLLPHDLNLNKQFILYKHIENIHQERYYLWLKTYQQANYCKHVIYDVSSTSCSEVDCVG